MAQAFYSFIEIAKKTPGLKTFYYLVKTARPRQWLKNLALFAALIFSGKLFDSKSFFAVLWAFFIFSLLTSTVYIFNDVVDLSLDRKHPFKRFRPVASGSLAVPYALFVSIVGFFVVLALARWLSFFFFFACLAYLVLHVLYSLWIKHLPILDLLAIATGFILRVYAGALVIDAHMSVWFLLTVVSLALFLAVGKRQGERTLLLGQGKKPQEHRGALGGYSNRLLDVYISMFANTTWITYAMFTFLEPQPVPTKPHIVGLLSILPHTFVTKKWLMATVPVVVYGIMRYLQLIYEHKKGESPDQVLVSDKPLFSAVIIWALMVIAIIYGIG